MLKRWDVTVDHVDNGALAVEKAKAKKYDFILMDIHMSLMNGFESSEHIKNTQNLNKLTPIFAVTADVLTNEVNQYSKLFDGILWKPLEIEKMYATKTRTIHSFVEQSVG